MPSTVVLFYPRAEPDFPDESKLLGVPLSILTVARPLVAAGYDVRLIDENVIHRVEDELREIHAPLWVGISCLGGGQIPSGLALAELSAKRWPGVPRVWGGWNPTLLPHLYERDDVAQHVDVIVRGRGEAPALEITKRLEARESLADISGVTWRDERGVLHRNEEVPLDDPTESDLLPYELIPSYRDYITRHGVLNYISSYGCPHRCTFCGIPGFTQTFRPTKNERVVEHFAAVKELGIHTIVFYDDNFFTSPARVLDLAQKLIDAEAGMSWYSNGRIDQLMRLSVDELKLLVASGCKGVNVGYETGVQAIADRVKKDVRVEDIFELATRFADAGVHLSANFMVGLPGETPSDLVESLETLHRVHALQPDLEVCWYMFMPAAATELWDTLIADGTLTEPRTLLDHTRLQSMYLEHPWYYVSPDRDVFREWREEHKKITWYFFMAYGAVLPSGRLTRWAFMKLRARCQTRFAKRDFALPWEWCAAFRFNRARTKLRWAWAAFRRTAIGDKLVGRVSWKKATTNEPVPVPWTHGST